MLLRSIVKLYGRARPVIRTRSPAISVQKNTLPDTHGWSCMGRLWAKGESARTPSAQVPQSRAHFGEKTPPIGLSDNLEPRKNKHGHTHLVFGPKTGYVLILGIGGYTYTSAGYRTVAKNTTPGLHTNNDVCKYCQYILRQTIIKGGSRCGQCYGRAERGREVSGPPGTDCPLSRSYYSSNYRPWEICARLGYGRYTGTPANLNKEPHSNNEGIQTPANPRLGSSPPRLGYEMRKGHRANNGHVR